MTTRVGNYFVAVSEAGSLERWLLWKSTSGVRQRVVPGLVWLLVPSTPLLLLTVVGRRKKVRNMPDSS